MALVNKNCYHACVVKKDEYVYCNPVQDFTLCGEKEFTFSIQFHPCDISQEMILFSQQDILRIGWHKGAFYYETEAAGKVSAEQWSMPLSENEWSQLDITCKNETITFYLNGILGYQEKITADSQAGTQDYRFGESFQGFIRYIRIANVCMEREEIIANQYQNLLKTEKLELFFDFSRQKAGDLGRHTLSIRFSGLSEIKDIVRSLYPGESGIAIPLKDPSVNPGGFQSGQYTIYHRVFLEYGQQKDTVVAGNGNTVQGIVLMVTTDHHMKFVWNGQEYCGATVLPVYQWLDLAAAWDGKKLRLYVNGVLDTETEIAAEPAVLPEGNMYIGNVVAGKRTLSGQSFRGYIDSVAVFDMALPAEKLLEYMEQPLYIYEEHLRALYQFYEKEPSESMTSGSISLTSGAAVCFAENTLRVDEIGEIQYNLGTTKGNYTDFQIWEANTVAMAIAAFVEERSGIKPSMDIVGGAGLEGGALDYVVDNVMDDPKARALLCSATAVTALEIAPVLISLGESGKLSVLFKTLYHSAKAFFAGMFSETEKSEVLSKTAMFLAGLMLFGTAAASVVNQKTKEPPPPTPPTPPIPDQEYKYRFLQVKTIQFQVSEKPSESAIPLAKSSKESVAVPEWVSGVNSNEQNPSLAAYISSQVKSVKAEVVFYYQTNYKDSIVLKVSASEIKGSVLGGISPFDLKVSTSGEYKKTITLNGQQIGKLAMGRYESCYNWGCNILGFLGRSYHKTYVLANVPAKPWSLVKGDLKRNVTVTALEFLRQVVYGKAVMGKAEPALRAGNGLDVAVRTVRHLLDSGRFQYPVYADPQYSCFNEDEDTVIFDQDRFDAAVNGSEKIYVNCLDCSAVIVNNCALAGHTLSVMEMKADGEADVIEIDGERIECLPLIRFDKTILVGESSWKELEDIDTHYVAAQGNNDNLSAVLYDGCLIGCGEGDTKVYAEGLPFTKTASRYAAAKDRTCYRETWIKEGNSCNIDGKYGVIHGAVEAEDGVEGQELSMPVVSSFISENNILYICTDYRYNFDTLITNAMPVQNGQNRCHSISYSAMCEAIGSPINAYMQGELSAAEVQQYLNGLWQIVFLNHSGAGVDASFYRGSAWTISTIFLLLNTNSPAVFHNNPTLWRVLTDNANVLVRQMNNSRNNLRVGDANWNQSVGAAFDPVSWYHVNKRLLITSDQTTLAYAQPMARPAGLPPFVEKGFYLPDRNDGVRLYGMFHHVYGNASFSIDTAKAAGTRGKYVYSSSNRFNMPTSLAAPEPVYYLYGGAWVQV